MVLEGNRGTEAPEAPETLLLDAKITSEGMKQVEVSLWNNLLAVADHRASIEGSNKQKVKRGVIQ